MITCLGSFLAAALVGALVLSRSMPLTAPSQIREKLLAYPAVLFTALLAAGMAGLIVYLLLSSVK